MPVSLIVGTNSYVDIEYANLYFASRLNADIWLNATADQMAQALIMATIKIDRLKIKGAKANSAQTLAFPRRLYYLGGWMVESEVKEYVKQAVCEEALALLKGIPKRIELQQQGVKSMSVGNLSETYSGSPKKLISEDALELLQPYMSGGYEVC